MIAHASVKHLFAFGLTATLLHSGCASEKVDTGPGANDAAVSNDAGTADSGSLGDTGLGVDTGLVADAGLSDGGLAMGVAPPRRGDMAFAVDPTSERVIMVFGDRAEPAMCNPAASDFVDDAFVFDPRTGRWAAIEIAAGPKPLRRARSSGAWDVQRNRFVLFGGRFREGTSGAYTFLRDLWALDPTTGIWTELSAQTNAQAPSGRMNATMLADPDRDRILIHAGGTVSGTSYTVDSQTWAFSLASGTWSQIGRTGTLPTPRLFHTAALDRRRNRMYVFSGAGRDAFTAPNFFRDLWSLDLEQGTWSQAPLPPDALRGRLNARMDLDEARDRLVLFGGHDDRQLGNENDVWTFDLALQTWTRRIAGDRFNRLFPGSPFCDFPADFANVELSSPERRESHLFVIHRSRAVMYGGRTDCGLANDTWTLDLETLTWTQVTISFNGMTCFRSGRTDCNDPTAKKCG